MSSPELSGFHRVRADVSNIVDRFNLHRVWYWLGLSGLVGIVGGAGALAFNWLTQQGVQFFWVRLIGYAPKPAGGEPYPFPIPPGPPSILGLLLVPMIGGLASALLVYGLAPEAEGHGTDAAIRAYHRDRGRLRARIPAVKLFASAFTLASGGSAGREGPIAQIGAGFGSLLGGWLKRSDRERRILLAAGMAAGIGAIFRAPLAGALFAAEVLYGEPDIESDVVVPALLSSIVAYSIYCSVHGFGHHLLTGTNAFTFHDPRALLPYLVLSVVTALGGIAFINIFGFATASFKRLRIPNVFKPVLGAFLTGLVGLVAWKASGNLASLSVMGAGYGILQDGVSAAGALRLPVGVLAVVAIGKMITTSLTIGSGGSGGVFGPSMVIGGCLGALVGSAFHVWMPDVVPEIGPFTIVGMAGFFAGAANTPISTVLMIGDITGNYSLLLPSMLVVGLSYTIARRWTIYPEQVPTRAQSPAHHGEFFQDMLANLRVGDVFDPMREVRTVRPETQMREITRLITETTQQYFPVVNAEGKVKGIFSLNDVRELLYAEEIASLVVAQDIATADVLVVMPNDTLQVALELQTIKDLGEVPVVSEEDGRLLGVLTRRDIISAYKRQIAKIQGEQASQGA